MNERLLAQCVTLKEGTRHEVEICGPARLFDGTSIETPADVINQIMPFAYGLAAIILLLVFIWAGFDMILSRGNPEKIKTAKAKITSGVVGIILLSLAYFITRLVSQIFNIGGGIF